MNNDMFLSCGLKRRHVHSQNHDCLLQHAGVVQPLSLEMNADSDDELTSLQERSGNAYRFDVLRELWSAVRVR